MSNTKPGFMEKRPLQQKEQDVYEISKVAIKIVAYFNQDVTVWDSKMYEQKHVVIDLLNQLNQNKENEQ
tara:strand:+ start:121 stop:327 length:207 start_codon:yes stop_codon:yes gene_type:complete